MHRCSVFKNSCLNVPVDPISKMPKTAYERNEKDSAEQCSIESTTSCSITGADLDAEKLKDFYRSIPDYNDINHLSESEFYSTLKRLREKKKLMLGLAVEQIDDCKIYDDKIFAKSDKDVCSKQNFRLFNDSIANNIDADKLNNVCRNESPKKNIKYKKSVRKLDNNVTKNIGEANEKNIQMEPATNSALAIKGNSKLNRPKRNHSACSISWHDDKVDETNNEVGEKFEKCFERDRYLADDYLYKTQSMPSSPLRTKSLGADIRRRQKSTTIPKPFKMTERYEDDRIANELRSLQKSLSEDMLHKKLEKKRFRAKPVPIESRIPLYDKILEDQAMRRAITKINSEAELRAQMKPFSFTKKEEGCTGICERAANILPIGKKKKRFRARPIPKNLFSNYFYDKAKEEQFFRTMNRRIRAEEMLRNSSLPVSTVLRDRSRLSTPAAHSDLPIDPSLAAPSITSSDKHRPSSPTKTKRKTKFYKENFITTSPQPFRFNTAERASKKIKDISKKIYQDSKSSGSGNGSVRNDGIFNKTEAYSALELKGIAVGRSNLAALLRAEAVRRKFELETARRLADQRKRIEIRNRDRVLRSNPAWHLVKNNHEEDIAMRLQTRRDEENMRREEFLHEMELMYGRVQQQPMLFERYYAPRSGATTADAIQLSPRKIAGKKRSTKMSKSYQLPKLRGDFLKYLDKIEANNLSRLHFYEEGVVNSLERE